MNVKVYIMTKLGIRVYYKYNNDFNSNSFCYFVINRKKLETFHYRLNFHFN